MINDFKDYVSNYAEINTLDELSGSVLAIEASSFLRYHFENKDGTAIEGLVPALGGIPYSLRSYIEHDLNVLQEAEVKIVVVFDGLDSGKKYAPFEASNSAVERCEQAWKFYEDGDVTRLDGQQAVRRFEESGAMKIDCGYGLLQSILKQRNISFQVAPHKANAQLAYLYNDGTGYVDAVAGSYDLLLYNVDRVITHLDTEQKQFSFIDRTHWMDNLAVASHDQFVDACVLSGTTFLRPFPSKQSKQRDIPAMLNMMRMNGDTGLALCRNMENDPQVMDTDYIDRFKRTRLAIKHSVVLTSDGKIEPLEADNIPMDLHEMVGQRLPEELYYYLSIGALNAGLLNEMSSNMIYEQIPLDGGHSEDYRRLVSEKLLPVKQTAITLLSKSLHRAYLHREYTFRFWFSNDSTVTFKPVELDSPESVVDSWKVTKQVLDSLGSQSSNKDQRPSLLFAIGASTSNAFPAKTLLSDDEKKQISLLTPAEMNANILFRILHLRQYINNSHQLTSWGTVLNTILQSLSQQYSGPLTTELEEAALLAVELLRYELLSTATLFPNYRRPSGKDSDKDKAHRTLLSRIGSLLHLTHKDQGYTGILNRRLLGYNSMVTAVQKSLRDLTESCFATLLLQNDTNRDDSLDLTSISQSLPFNTPRSAALGVAVNHYLESTFQIAPDFEASSDNSPPNGTTSNASTLVNGASASPLRINPVETAPEALANGHADRFEKWKIALKTTRTGDWLPHAVDVAGDLEKVWGLWKAVFEGVRKAEEMELVREGMAEEWSVCDQWLGVRK